MLRRNWQESSDIPESPQEEARRASVWLPTIAALILVAIAGFACPLPRIGTLTVRQLILFAAALLFVATLLGGLVAFGVRALLLQERKLRADSVVITAALIALWVPAWTIGLQLPSLLTILAGCCCMASISLFLGKNNPRTAEERSSGRYPFPFQFESKSLAHVLLPSIVLALLVDAAIVSAVSEHYRLASMLAGASLAWTIWRASTSSARIRAEAPASWSSRVSSAVLAFAFTLIVLLPYLKTMRFFPGLSLLLAKGGGAGRVIDKPKEVAAAPDSDGYSGIILLPPKEQQKKILAPTHREDPTRYSGHFVQPMEIPFDGAYWYFKSPDKAPRPTARVVHGSSTKVSIRSSDRYPLLMEAHQKLSNPIDLGCCSEIDITVQNADHHEGPIALELWVRKRSGPSAVGHYLGTMTIPSSERPMAMKSDATGLPPEERLSFPVPAAMGGILFDEITLVVIPAPARARLGAQVAIRKFVLQP